MAVSLVPVNCPQLQMTLCGKGHFSPKIDVSCIISFAIIFLGRTRRQLPWTIAFDKENEWQQRRMHSGQFARIDNVASFQGNIFDLVKVLGQTNDGKLHHSGLCLLPYETDR